MLALHPLSHCMLHLMVPPAHHWVELLLRPSRILICRSFAASASDAAQPAKAALSQRMLAQKPAKRSAPAKATEKPEPTKQHPLRMTQGGHTANINTPMMARKGAFQQQSMSSVNVIVEPYK